MFGQEDMKLQFTTRHAILLIAGVNLTVAVISLAIQAFAKHDPYWRVLETVFSFVTFPLLFIAGLGCVRGNIMFWRGSVGAIPVFYALLVLNALVWGVVGVCLYGWLHRTFWIKPEHRAPDDEIDLRWDTCFVVFTHAVLILLLSGLLVFLVPVPFQLLGRYFGALPTAAEWLFQTSAVWRHPVVNILLAVGFLLADGRIYWRLCRFRGKRAGTIWAVGVTAAIVLAVVWYFVLSLVFLNTVIQWRLT